MDPLHVRKKFQPINMWKQIQQEEEDGMQLILMRDDAADARRDLRDAGRGKRLR
jgi:hypothetical protein